MTEDTRTDLREAAIQDSPATGEGPSAFDDVPTHADGSEHEWWDADDDETGWHCRVCGVTVYPNGEPDPVVDSPATGEGLRELRALSDAATPGPWTVIEDGTEEGRIVAGSLDSWGERTTLLYTVELADVTNDAVFIAAAVNYVRSALAATTLDPGEAE